LLKNSITSLFRFPGAGEIDTAEIGGPKPLTSGFTGVPLKTADKHGEDTVTTQEFFTSVPLKVAAPLAIKRELPHFGQAIFLAPGNPSGRDLGSKTFSANC